MGVIILLALRIIQSFAALTENCNRQIIRSRYPRNLFISLVTYQPGALEQAYADPTDAKLWLTGAGVFMEILITRKSVL